MPDETEELYVMREEFDRQLQTFGIEAAELDAEELAAAELAARGQSAGPFIS